MKITFAHYDSAQDVGGVSSWLRRLLPSLKQAGHTVSVDMLNFAVDWGTNCKFFASEGIPFRVAHWREFTAAASMQFLKWLADDPPDVYVPNCIIPAYFAAGLARRQGVSTIGVLHSDDPFYWGVVDEFVAGPAEWRLSGVVSVSQYIEDELRSVNKFGLPAWRIGYSAPVPRHTATPPKDVLRLVYAGRLVEEQKRISEVTRALCSAARRFHQVHAWIVGNGDQKRVVQDILATEQHFGKVQLIGHVDCESIQDIFAQCHAFVLLSDYEGLPISLLEAMAAGLVPICLDMKSGVKEVLVNEHNGLIVKDRNEDFLIAARKLVDGQLSWVSMSQNARYTVLKSFSHDRMVRQWNSFFENLRPMCAPRSLKVPNQILLPARNPKFGKFDCRPGLRDKARSLSRKLYGYVVNTAQ